MKVRLVSAPLTTEDDWTWYIVMCRKNGRMFGIRSFSLQSARRDAELMFLAQKWREEGIVFLTPERYKRTAEAIDVRQGEGRL
jgi:hypothetical protein